jgi:hypothetical protein
MNIITHQHSGIFTVAAGATGMIIPILSNQPFDTVTLCSIPNDSENTPYRIDVYFHGRLEETHTFPDPNGGVNCFMSFPDFLFPANAGTPTIPAYFDPSRKDFYGIPLLMSIVNLDSVDRTFYIYALFKTYGFIFKEITQKK